MHLSKGKVQHSENTLTTFKNSLLKNHSAYFKQTWHKFPYGKGGGDNSKIRIWKVTDV